jgi:hypothetical protein
VCREDYSVYGGWRYAGEDGLVLRLGFERRPDPRLDQAAGGRKGDRAGRERVDEFQLYGQFVAGHEGAYLIFKPRDDLCMDSEGILEAK